MSPTISEPVPDFVLSDLISFISKSYRNSLPNSLLIAQAFILKYPNHGRKYGLSAINSIIEKGIKKQSFLSSVETLNI